MVGDGMTLLDRIVDTKRLDEGVREGFIRLRHDEDLGLSILNYTDYAQVTPRSWENPAVRACRGIIFDPETLRVHARPWEKFFNHGQKEAAQISLDESVVVMDKLDGSLGIGYLDCTGQPRISTRGSLSSDQAIHATEWLWMNLHLLGRPERLRTSTPLFEVIYPENRIVCDYGDRDELVLLGAVHVETGIAIDGPTAAGYFGWTGAVVEEMPHDTLREALEAKPRAGAEGLVVMSMHQPQALVKIKQEDYVALHRIVTWLSERAVWERMMAGEDIETLVDGIPDELHGWVEGVYNGLLAETTRLELHTRDIFLDIVGKCGSVNVSRKEFALLANQHTDIRPWLFLMLDGKDVETPILKSLKPTGDVRPHHKKEAA